MNKTLPTLGLLATALSLPLTGLAQTTVFTDTFSNGSTLNGTSTPGGTATASSTSYDIASTKAATTGPAIATGDFTLKLNAATTGGFLEAQAIFTSTPVTLMTAGDYINLTYVFTDTGGTVLAGGASSYFFNGLYNSGGSTPLAGSLNNSGLSTASSSPFATGNAANWQGYVSRTAASTGNNQLYSRGQQTGVGTTSANQDLIGNGFGSGAYNNPNGTAISSTASAVALTSGGVYTNSYQITLSAAGTLAITNTLLGSSGTIYSLGNTITGASVVTNYDGLAIGIRNSGTSFNPTMDISQIKIIDNIQAVPEPTTLALTGIGIAMAAGWYRRTRQ